MHPSTIAQSVSANVRVSTRIEAKRSSRSTVKSAHGESGGQAEKPHTCGPLGPSSGAAPVPGAASTATAVTPVTVVASGVGPESAAPWFGANEPAVASGLGGAAASSTRTKAAIRDASGDEHATAMLTAPALIPVRAIATENALEARTRFMLPQRATLEP